MIAERARNHCDEPDEQTCDDISRESKIRKRAIGVLSLVLFLALFGGVAWLVYIYTTLTPTAPLIIEPLRAVFIIVAVPVFGFTLVFFIVWFVTQLLISKYISEYCECPCAKKIREVVREA